ncbi:L-aspartate oxidase [Hydrogenivirga sp. 128-5-R1-1]|uniref:L-aspartate oxidase n=1 Tax=Hydrogenivirga sp. 128-5-R1-1 TaxID=392423 RepID=UPI00015F37EB|nr:L-aspartate oxidase [Hydrogenivirga sp. 128-5-R1-1]EDP76301.1 L-aspartate oxidase [Hydrogenivirga sp. 128-5-R1-1]
MRYFLNFDTSLLPSERADVLICGSGIGGLTTAIVLRELGLSPALLTRGIGNTYYSQGGIAGAVHPADSPYVHFLDTIRAGRFLNDEKATEILVNDGVMRIADLERWGVGFDREGDTYSTTTEGGHSFPRVLKVKDYTGREIYTKLLQRVEELKIPIIHGELQEVVGDQSVQGALYHQEGSLRFVRARAVVLATGGAASMFRHTSNPSKVRGDGIGIAFRSGAVIKNPEFVQFHPTVLKGTNLLISEAVRGEGAHLVDDSGERFVDELQPRDVVARAIFNVLKHGRDVFLDLRPLIGRGINLGERFPTILSFLTEKGIDPAREPVPVVPAAHYYIGGIEVDISGRTSVEGLYAVGECTCTGVHGANRLASNSLLEGVVFGYRTAYRLYLDIKFLRESRADFKNYRECSSKLPFGFEELKAVMWENVGLEREEEGLLKARHTLTEWLLHAERAEPSVENRQLFDLLLVALATVEGALFRKESRGVHYRSDYPYEREVFRRDTAINPGDILG